VLDPYFSEGVTMLWEGSCVDGKANGFGKLTKSLYGEYESTYEGEYKNGTREGQGKFTHADGTTRTGIFVNGQMVGKGVMISEDGEKYVGNFINNSAHGFGTIDYPDGDKSTGFFVSDELYTGKIISKDGTVTYYHKKQEVPEIFEKKSNYHPEIGVELTEYFDKYFNRCSKEKQVYYRQIIYQADNKPTDTVKTYYKNGQLYAKAFAVYLDYDDEGKSFYEGDAIFYFQDGKIKERLYLINNKVSGLDTSYYPNGQMAEQRNFVGGLEQGICKEWYENGKLKSIGLYEDGYLLSDYSVEYDENGSRKEL
jgi:antitoxin component YwqK of YwqJK toxin-antitoxin module